MHADLTPCGAEALTAAMFSLPLAILLAFLPLVYAWRRGRAQLGWAASLALVALTPFVWFNAPGVGLLPREWYDCEAPLRILIILTWVPLVIVAVGVVIAALIGRSSARDRASGKTKSPPTEGGPSS